MKERPILFSDESVCQILSGKKTQTRRVIKPQPDTGDAQYRSDGIWSSSWDDGTDCYYLEKLNQDGKPTEKYLDIGRCPYGLPGDRLWVRETWAGGDMYRADLKRDRGIYKWKSPMFLPRERSRIDLEIVSIRVERLQEISVDDILAEGIRAEPGLFNIQKVFKGHWNSINARRGFPFELDPWVWCIKFRKMEK